MSKNRCRAGLFRVQQPDEGRLNPSTKISKTLPVWRSEPDQLVRLQGPYIRHIFKSTAIPVPERLLPERLYLLWRAARKHSPAGVHTSHGRAAVKGLAVCQHLPEAVFYGRFNFITISIRAAIKKAGWPGRGMADEIKVAMRIGRGQKTFPFSSVLE